MSWSYNEAELARAVPPDCIHSAVAPRAAAAGVGTSTQLAAAVPLSALEPMTSLSCGDPAAPPTAASSAWQQASRRASAVAAVAAWYSSVTTPAFVLQFSAEFLPRDCIIVLALVSRGCNVIAGQEMHHRRRVGGSKSSSSVSPSATLIRALAALPRSVVSIVRQWAAHIIECINTRGTPLDRRPSIPGMELGGQIADRVDIEWGVRFPGYDEHVHWTWKAAFGDGEDEAPCAFLGAGVLDEREPQGGVLFCLSLTCAQRQIMTVGGITYVTVALLLDEQAKVVDLTWCYVMGASGALALRSPTSENELVFSSHPTVFGHLHRLNGTKAPSAPDGPVPLASLERFRIPLAPRSNRSSLRALLALLEGAADGRTFLDVLRDDHIIPISRAVARIREPLFAIKGLTRDLTTPKGIWKIDSGEADITLVDVGALWQRRADKQLLMAERRSGEVRTVLQAGVLPLGSLLCLDLDSQDAISSPSQVYLA